MTEIPNCKPSSCWTWIRRITPIVTALSTVGATGLAYWVWLEYEKMNNIMLVDKFDLVYSSISRSYIDDRGVLYSSIYDSHYVSLMNAGNSAYFATLSIQNFLPKEERNIFDQIVIFDALERGISHLSCLIWQKNPLMEELSNQIRKMHFHAEQYTYLMHSAFEAAEKGVITNVERDYWMAFMDDFGDNPVFILNIHDGHRFGYFSRDFSEYLHDYYNNKEFGERNGLRRLFPDLFLPKEKWMLLHKNKDFC